MGKIRGKNVSCFQSQYFILVFYFDYFVLHCLKRKPTFFPSLNNCETVYNAGFAPFLAQRYDKNVKKTPTPSAPRMDPTKGPIHSHAIFHSTETVADLRHVQLIFRCDKESKRKEGVKSLNYQRRSYRTCMQAKQLTPKKIPFSLRNCECAFCARLLGENRENIQCLPLRPPTPF